jgi:hypothetical protein
VGFGGERTVIPLDSDVGLGCKGLLCFCASGAGQCARQEVEQGKACGGVAIDLGEEERWVEVATGQASTP